MVKCSAMEKQLVDKMSIAKISLYETQTNSNEEWCWYPSNYNKRKTETKKTWLKMLRNVLRIYNLTDKIVSNRVEWQDRIHVANPFSCDIRL